MWKQRCIWGVLLLLSLIAISIYGGDISYGFFYFCVSMPLISLLYLLYVFMRFRLYQEVDTQNIIVGQKIPYRFVLKNEDWVAYNSVQVNLYADYSYVEEISDNTEYCLFPADKVEHNTMLYCKYRGEYEVGVKEIVIIDFLRIFRIKYPIPFPTKVLVAPKTVKIQQMQTLSESDVFMESSAALEKNDLDVLMRDYTAGDSLKTIHWKASARDLSLKTRLFIGNQKQKAAFLLDLYNYPQVDRKTELAVQNKMMETYIALLYHFALKQVSACVLWKETGIYQQNMVGMTDFFHIYETLSRVIFKSDSRMEEFVALTQHITADANRNIWVVNQISDELMVKVAELTELGKIVNIYVISDDSIERYKAQINAGIKITLIHSEQDLLEVL